ncbi:class I adenylate-forming enzyme family protein [Mycolicibacterium agri]|nr:AMP-binding protein [Mycolicibacterium agri]
MIELEWIKDHPGSSIALVEGDRSISYGELRDLIAATAEVEEEPVRYPFVTGFGIDGIIAYLSSFAAERPIAVGHGESFLIDEQAHFSNLSPATAVVMSTSGTTGLPKLVELSRQNLTSNCRTIATVLGLGPSDRALGLLPLDHSFGLSVLNSTLVSGGTYLVSPRLLSGRSIVNAVESLQITNLPLVPTLAYLLNRKLPSAAVNGLNLVQMAGGGVSRDLITDLGAKLPIDTRIFVMYGLTEATARVSAFDARKRPDKIGSAGVPLPGVTVRISRSDIEEYPEGVGEIVVGGDGVGLNVADNRGELHTGDIGFVDSEGFLYIVGRSGLFAKVGGTKVSLYDLEMRLTSASIVRVAVAFPRQDEVYGESICVLIELHRGTEPSYEAVAQIRECVVDLGLPILFRFVEEIPTTRSRKVRRFGLESAWENATEVPGD